MFGFRGLAWGVGLMILGYTKYSGLIWPYPRSRETGLQMAMHQVSEEM